MTILNKPPAGWKRPSIPLSVKVKVLESALRDAWSHWDCNHDWIGNYTQAQTQVEYDHRPPLSERKFDTETNDTIPPANDPDRIEAIPMLRHRARTFGRGGEKRITTLGSDAHNRAKTKRLVASYMNVPIYTSSRPLPGGRNSKLKKKLSGKVVKRSKR